MANVDLIATKDFSYYTRRLKAGDAFTVDAEMARVLVAIKKAEAPRVPGRVAAPPPSVLAAAGAVAPPVPDAVPALSTTSLRAKGTPRKGRRRATKKG